MTYRSSSGEASAAEPERWEEILPTPPKLLDAPTLAAGIREGRFRAVDCTVWQSPLPDNSGYAIESGWRDHAEARIPGSVFLDLVSDLRGPRADIRFDPPGGGQVAAWLAARGIGRDSIPVFYCRRHNSFAARAWWTFAEYGVDGAILDGGWTAWQDAALFIERKAKEPPPPLRPKLLPARGTIATTDDVRAAVAAGDVQLIHTLSLQEFTGRGGVHDGRPGRIPGSLHVPASSMIAPNNRFRPSAELRELLAAGGVDLLRPAICYCGGGTAASIVAVALRLAGAADVRLYLPSLQEWVRDPANEVVTG